MSDVENKNNLLIYKNKDGNIIVDAMYKDETLWLSQKGMSKVFDCSTDNISLHLKNIFKNIWFSLASVATISASVFLFCLFFSILTNIQFMVKNMERDRKSVV